ncbi:MAG: polyprenol monophosphomannose synthase [bacterium]|nr:polyprenol monophosphomannose synthase [bacterium]
MHSVTGDQTLVVIPTYNERDNVRSMSEQILSQYAAIDLLFVDDNSPDGTGALLNHLAAGNPRIHVLHRVGKLGLGTAYIAGFKWALERQYQFVIEMDGDFSHDPKYLADFLCAIQKADLVLGSRYTVGVSVINWPLSRLLLSKFATSYVRLVTDMPASDATGGFKCFRRAVLEKIDFDKIHSNGYSFQIELTYYTWLAGFRIREIPIVFHERAGGISKMNKKIVHEAIGIVWRLFFKHLLVRKPPRMPFYQPDALAWP